MTSGAGKALWALGMMSGTSLDGIDAAFVRTDGRRILGFGPAATFPYADDLREGLRGHRPADVAGGDAVVAAMTWAHVEAARALLELAGRGPGDVALIGFHGHTVLHRPDAGETCQIGDGDLLARETGIRVVSDMRGRDMAEGGEGAPLAPLFHRALAEPLEKPLAVLNLGGVANLTWLSPDGAVVAFDTGPANAPVDDWVRRHTGAALDEDGRIAHAGRVDEAVLATLLAHPYFERPCPKSLDRDDFAEVLGAAEGLATEDGAVTLTAFAAAAVVRSVELLPAPPLRWLVTGGGRHNPALMGELRRRLMTPVEPVEAVGWHGDALEAQAFGFLAVRALMGLPLTLPSTTGVAEPTTGGVFHDP